MDEKVYPSVMPVAFPDNAGACRLLKQQNSNRKEQPFRSIAALHGADRDYAAGRRRGTGRGWHCPAQTCDRHQPSSKPRPCRPALSSPRNWARSVCFWSGRTLRQHPESIQLCSRILLLAAWAAVLGDRFICIVPAVSQPLYENKNITVFPSLCYNTGKALFQPSAAGGAPDFSRLGGTMNSKKILFILMYYFGLGYVFGRIVKALLPGASQSTFTIAFAIFILAAGFIEIRYITPKLFKK
ncbi:hypothetical protein JQN58_18070 [Aneurinibacillus sp. BA2021]|nr:hypothetical protein [Aneurinibacillus sp. BA2021]